MLSAFWQGTVATDLLAEIKIGAILSTVPVGGLIVVFCHPLNNMNPPYVFYFILTQFQGGFGEGDRCTL